MNHPMAGACQSHPVFGSGATQVVNRTHLHGFSVVRANCGRRRQRRNRVGRASTTRRKSGSTSSANATNRLVTGPSPTGISVEYAGDHIFSSNATQAYFTMADAAGVTLTDPEFGLNGGERFAVACQIMMTGAANALEIIGGALIAQVPAGQPGGSQ